MTSTTTTIRKSYGSRKISTCADDYYRLLKPKNLSNSAATTPKKSEDVAKLVKYIDDNIIGKNNAFVGPFGRRKVVFCDYGSSGRSLQFIEEYITREVLPCYGNTHTTTNITSLQSNLFRQEAREIIKNAVNASDEDAVIFVGHGCTGAIKKLVNALDLHESPIVFVGASEHQDNLHIWQEIGAKIIRIAETKQNFLDLNDLEEQLKRYESSGKQLVGCFAATSSVTGILVDDIAATMLLHQYDALAFWDYNLAAPYVTLNMNPNVPGVEDQSLASKDAIYFSGHKFIGGVQTPGILVAKKSLFKRVSTCEPDGIFALHEQNKSFELTEEGTSAAVIESIRAGLVMQLKEAVTVHNIAMKQDKITKQMLQHIRTIPEVILLGNTSSGLKRIPVFSFMVRHPRGTFLHHNFVCAVLNDVFGIQARGGCPCSAAYAQDLLGIDENLAKQYENIILEERRLSSLNLSMENSHLELLRPGFTRISLPYFISDHELAFIMEAVKMVATEGWKLLPQYAVDSESGEWRHHANPISRDRKWLGSIRYVDGKMTMNERRISGPGLFPQSYSECLQTARNLFNRARKMAIRNSIKDQGIRFENRAEKLRWFMLQHEAQDILTGTPQNIKHAVPFNPLGFSGSKKNVDRDDVSINHPVSNTSSPRHFSLPAIDDHRVLTCSSPVPYFVQGDGFYFPANTFATQQSAPVNFAVGEHVNNNNAVPHNVQPMIFRERCYSLGAPAVTQSQNTILSPQTQLSLGMRQRHCSCSSANNDFQSIESEANGSPTHSINMLSNIMGRASPNDFGTRMTEMTKELATNIKSELREVINKVEDALDSTDFSKHGSGSEDGRSDSISALEMAEYLEKFSKEMADDVKSEIRDIVSAVDTYVTPDRRSYSRASSSGDSDNNKQEQQKYTPGSSSETVKQQVINKSNSSDRLCDNDDNMVLLRKVLHENVNKLSSQDSGINLSFSEMDVDLVKVKKSFQHYPTPAFNVIIDDVSSPKEEEPQQKVNKWVCPPKNIWQSAVEAIQEFEMIRNGDRILVCLSGGKDSLSLLHTLLQYQSVVINKGIVFTVGAVTVDPAISGCDPCVLLPHLKSLGVHYVVDDNTADNNSVNKENAVNDENYCTFADHDLRQRLYSTAKSGGYNVLAIGQHLDDFIESFLLSIFHTGKLRTLKTHYFIKEHDLRVVRPFVYTREKILRHFASQHFGPLLNNSPSLEMSKQRQRIKQLIAQQEILFPKLFCNLKLAIRPLISFHDDDDQEESKTRRRNNNKSKCENETAESFLETDEEPVFD